MKNINYLAFCALISFTIVTADTSNIFQDVREGNKEAIKKRLENCEDCSVKDNQGNNALHIAIEENNAEIVEMLTTTPEYAGWMDWLYAFIYAPTLPNINEKNNSDETPLHCTIKGNKQNITRLLLQKHANVEIVNKENLSAVFAAIKNDAPHFIPIFVAHNLDLSKHRRDGETILHYAIKEKKSNSIRYCIQETSLINASNNKHQTPVLLAIEEENFGLLDLLYKGLNIPADNGVKPIHYATRNGKCNAINYLLQHSIAIDEPDKEGNSALFYAISQDNVDMVNYLLARGANLQKRNNAGEDAFAIASRNKDPRIARYLANMPGVDIDGRDNKGQTAFMRLSIARDYEGMKRLLNFGVNIRITDNMRENALHKIARNGDYKAAQIALNHDPLLLHDCNNDGLTPLSLAAQQHGQNDLLVLLITQKANVNSEDNNGLTALHHASAHDNVDAIITLQKYGASCEKRTKNGNTVAHSAAEKGSLRTLRYWIEHNAQLLHVRNKHDETPFIIAAKHGKRETVELLLCDIDFVNKDINRAQYLATMHGHYDTARFLQQKGTARLKECQEILTIRMATLNLISENNNSFHFIHQKNHQLTYIPASLSYYSENQLYDMPQSERNKIKNLYLEGQNRELKAKTIFLQAINNIRLEEEQQARASERARIQERDRLVAERQAAERVAAAQASSLAKTSNDTQQHIAQFQGQDIIISLPASQVYPPQEEDEVITQEIARKECCICFEDQSIITIPCKNKHSDSICRGCLTHLKMCPICRAELTK